MTQRRQWTFYRYKKSSRHDSHEQENRQIERERRRMVTVLTKLFFICTCVIMFCELMGISVYNCADMQQLRKVVDPGLSEYLSIDTKIYVQPDNITTIHEPNDVCPNSTKNERYKLFLLIFVCSSTTNFRNRNAIRKTWANYQIYLKASQIFHKIRNMYKNFNYTDDLTADNNTDTSEKESNVENDNLFRLSNFVLLLNRLSKGVQDNRVNNKTKEVSDEGADSKEYKRSLRKLKFNVSEIRANKWPHHKKPDFKVVFLLGMPSGRNAISIQEKIDKEVKKYRDVVQERFVDSYKNLSLKSTMMLKWFVNNCYESVRYILKTDDDMYIDVPHVVFNLNTRSKVFDDSLVDGNTDKEYLITGSLISKGEPQRNSKKKWYSPWNVYSEHYYPLYVAGAAYVLSAPAVHALYKAALSTRFYHIEDVFITGICAVRSHPRIVPENDPTFTYHLHDTQCMPFATAHKIPPSEMMKISIEMLNESLRDYVE
ncbi:uncharacterized protein LOC128681387 isoform X2 [Plodia interpunctella]|uniref:uncharacterized protein LOC128681387 isoform X2 n=1 Tax=Plodia interpunctella TaxID=58824 RepID=UPI002367B28E|nr:uncharacterized protein LOC128681387 isoform X2 [Plodia interpunctella]